MLLYSEVLNFCVPCSDMGLVLERNGKNAITACT